MRIMLLLALSLFLSGISYSQSKSETFEGIQKLLNKAKGKKIMNLLGNDEKIGDQVFNETEISVTKVGQGKYSSTWVSDYSNINWSGFRYYLWPENSNDKIKVLRIEFKTPVTYVHHVKGKSGDSRTSNSIDLYFLAKDYDEMERLMKNGTR
jgi:hypothetical protein